MTSPPLPGPRPRVVLSLSPLPPHSGPIPIQSPLGDVGATVPPANPAVIRPELCDGPPSATLPSLRSSQDQAMVKAVSDRAELIKFLKRGESPTWIPSPRPESLLQLQSRHRPPSRPRSRSRSPRRVTKTPPRLLPPASIVSGIDRLLQGPGEGGGRAGLGRPSPDIRERPGSALHSGDFTTDQLTHDSGAGQDVARQHDASPFSPHRASSEPWLATPPSHHFLPSTFEGLAANARREAFGTGLSSLPSSLSWSFLYKAPTSPLVQAESNDDDDLDVELPTTPGNPGSAIRNRQCPAGQRQDSFVYQAHQPCRFPSSAAIFSASSSPQTPAPSLSRARLLSIGSESSPLLQQHTSMVGSYEESILRGRMSTTPSRPLEFTAQMGVLGLGKCKPALRCPPHVTLPFLAVFYRYPNTVVSGRNPATPTEHGPSPYVGQIDLENGLSHPGEADKRGAAVKRKMQLRAQNQGQAAGQEHNPARVVTDHDGSGSVVHDGNDAIMETTTDPFFDDDQWSKQMFQQPASPGPRLLLKQKRRSQSAKVPPRGAYRIPEKGQLQIIVKNQNKTAVKLFLVPYDLTGMEPGTKTFIRQRSYSAGPIIDQGSDLTPLDVDTGAVKSQSGGNGGENSGCVPTSQGSDAFRPVVRYLVHVHICCPSKGRFYLYRSIRIVFANRVPDGNERLRNEISLPEPRFTPYRPVRVVGAQPTQSLTPAVSRLTVFARTPEDVPSTTPPTQPQTRSLMASSFSFGGLGSLGNGLEKRASAAPIPSIIPFALDPRRRRSVVARHLDKMEQAEPGGPAGATTVATGASLQLPNIPESATIATKKLNRANAFDPSLLVITSRAAGEEATGPNMPVAEGLLSKRLRSLGVESPGGKPT